MSTKKILRPAIFFFLSTTLGSAQTVSLEELTAQIDANTSQIAGFRALLTDPDPARALAAMQAMLASGDPLLANLALEAGLTSSSGVMRKVALEKFMRTRPNLVAEAALVDEETDPASFATWMGNNKYAMTSATTGYIGIQVPPYDEEAKCHAVDGTCRVNVAGGDLSVEIGSSWRPNWGTFELMEGGQLVGSVLSYGGPVILRIDLLGVSGQ